MRFQFLIPIALVGFASQTLAAEALSGAQLKEVVSGHSFSWKSAKFNSSGTSSYKADGTFAVQMTGQTAETGKWVIKGNKVCGQVTGKKQNCSTWSRVDHKTFYLPAYGTTSVMTN